ncbi:unnamed protein product, partial [marine sediment metagenome]
MEVNISFQPLFIIGFHAVLGAVVAAVAIMGVSYAILYGYWRRTRSHVSWSDEFLKHLSKIKPTRPFRKDLKKVRKFRRRKKYHKAMEIYLRYSEDEESEDAALLFEFAFLINKVQ